MSNFVFLVLVLNVFCVMLIYVKKIFINVKIVWKYCVFIEKLFYKFICGNCRVFRVVL